ncbi:NUDIX domain-containing protein [Chlorogloeopsis sp. ULAP01]|uniref:bis(5'-nucleosyl)-tetraphosphatase n=1 Tax=Chlorogloeopsis sp. ULAP01 TaxID=3056483 RepID=UPI0025AB4887|nr:NUDIX domain-containing protein [Chlorogloeopsis sp. ULAP01]MDM9379933.1 NUDIX domain-containing protein [Chlorogloeopsis sp. ULAP01]
MQKKKSCGVIVMRSQPQMSFLLLLKPNSYDLPKGNIEPGEDEISCALRELFEESGITINDIELDEKFRFTVTYRIRHKRLKNKKKEKTVVIFLAWLKNEVSVKTSEHSGYIWMVWNPPHIIQPKTIDPLLTELENYLYG